MTIKPHFGNLSLRSIADTIAVRIAKMKPPITPMIFSLLTTFLMKWFVAILNMAHANKTTTNGLVYLSSSPSIMSDSSKSSKYRNVNPMKRMVLIARLIDLLPQPRKKIPIMISRVPII